MSVSIPSTPYTLADATSSTDGAMAAADKAALDRLNGHVFDVRAYGAVGNKTSDDTAAFQSAFDAATAAGGGIVFVPPGKYRISGTMTYAVSTPIGGEVIFRGCGGASQIFCDGDGDGGTTDKFTFGSNLDKVIIEDLMFLQYDVSGAPAGHYSGDTVLKLYATANEVRKCEFWGLDTNTANIITRQNALIENCVWHGGYGAGGVVVFETNYVQKMRFCQFYDVGDFDGLAYELTGAAAWVVFRTPGTASVLAAVEDCTFDEGCPAVSFQGDDADHRFRSAQVRNITDYLEDVASARTVFAGWCKHVEVENVSAISRDSVDGMLEFGSYGQHVEHVRIKACTYTLEGDGAVIPPWIFNSVDTVEIRDSEHGPLLIADVNATRLIETIGGELKAKIQLSEIDFVYLVAPPHTAGNYTVGTMFQAVKRNEGVNGIRFYWGGAAATTIKVALWDNTGSQLAVVTVSIPVSSPGVYEAHFDRVALTPFQNYYVSLYDSGGVSGYYSYTTFAANSSTPIAAGWNAQLLGDAYFRYAGCYQTGDAWPNLPDGGTLYIVEPLFAA